MDPSSIRIFDISKSVIADVGQTTTIERRCTIESAWLAKRAKGVENGKTRSMIDAQTSAQWLCHWLCVAHDDGVAGVRLLLDRTDLAQVARPE